MSDKLPDNIVRFDVLKADYGRRKICQCSEPHYVLDCQNRLVYCNDCGAIIEPFEALENLERKYHRIESRLEQMHNQAKEISNYKPHLRIFKDMEHRYQADHFSMIPICPHCKKPFEFSELITWVSRCLHPEYKK